MNDIKIDHDKLRSAVLLLSLDSRARKVLDDLDIADEASVRTLSRLLKAGAVSVDKLGQLFAKLREEHDVKPTDAMLQELAAAVRAHPAPAV